MNADPDRTVAPDFVLPQAPATKVEQNPDDSRFHPRAAEVEQTVEAAHRAALRLRPPIRPAHGWHDRFAYHDRNGVDIAAKSG